MPQVRIVAMDHDTPDQVSAIARAFADAGVRPSAGDRVLVILQIGIDAPRPRLVHSFSLDPQPAAPHQHQSEA